MGGMRRMLMKRRVKNSPRRQTCVGRPRVMREMSSIIVCTTRAVWDDGREAGFQKDVRRRDCGKCLRNGSSRQSLTPYCQAKKFPL